MIAESWNLDVEGLDYLPVGFGSHHWKIGETWFVTADDKPHEALAAALSAVPPSVGVAPAAPLVTVGRWTLQLYPYLTGESFAWGEFSSPEHRAETLRMVREVHRSPFCQARLDTFRIHGRDAALAFTPGRGPFGARAADLLASRAEVLETRFRRYDALVRDALNLRDRMVLTHGEPHPGNTMRTTEGWRLIDWDTALISHPERDLWLLGETEGALPWLLDLYGLRWRLSDVAAEAGRFSRDHTGTEDDAFGWTILRDTVNDL
ncbi:phosphotransferase [Herbidospora cretacea]|uniref:phosphotransferase n=1 Tax=Herbidospora cretacea TaxID=28444 RepID=UPI000774C852|nr:phosphotransferase [Herbidospora cretacea]